MACSSASAPILGRCRAPSSYCLVYRLYVLLIFVIVSLSGGGGCAPFTLKVNINVDPDANSNSPVALSVLVVYKKDAAEKLQALPAKTWFKQREQFLRDYPKDIEEINLEFIPGQQIVPLKRSVRWNAVQGFIFANYRSPGDHRHVFDPRNQIQIACGQKDLVLTVVPSTLDKLRGLAKEVPTEAPSLDPAGALK